MRLVVDTNVLVSGIFFSGPPSQILEAWRNQQLQFVMSLDILHEYQRVSLIMAEKFLQVDIQALLDLLIVNSEVVDAPPLSEQVSADPDDDMFIACAVASDTRLIVSGDRHLLDVNGVLDICVLNPRDFVEEYLNI